MMRLMSPFSFSASPYSIEPSVSIPIAMATSLRNISGDLDELTLIATMSAPGSVSIPIEIATRLADDCE